MRYSEELEWCVQCMYVCIYGYAVGLFRWIFWEKLWPPQLPEKKLHFFPSLILTHNCFLDLDIDSPDNRRSPSWEKIRRNTSAFCLSFYVSVCLIHLLLEAIVSSLTRSDLAKGVNQNKQNQ